ncbi:YhfC family intramembrane metalloprotease [Radiobacillus kanasensis]|uniref:YhfC family intramembrane metalloprotease n=1 Tax=Radiobacillus kanasensis TaxID=2844358 RepID=UPI001E2B9CF1|nr:YhfC family intramembrane metalloprotease [Radiobacillus kanasensis]UFU01193.1 YhfC family intramembrane metalloprotease [Radiobacillus kanasensis]
MVSNLQFSGMALQAFIVLGGVIGLFLYMKKKDFVSWKAIGVGVLIFFLFSQILEKILHVVVLAPSGTELKWNSNPYVFMLYGGLAAGVFEEIGRYLGFKWILKNNRSFKDGMSFGFGHGGFEALLIALLGAVNSFVVATMINSGTLDDLIGTGVTAESVQTIKEQVVNTGFFTFILGGVERLPAILLHIALSLLVLYGVHKGFRFVLYAIAIHAFVDFAPALYQAGVITNLWLLEVYLIIIGVLSFLGIKRLKIAFQNNINPK